MFSLGDLSFTGKFSTLNKTVKTKPISVIICKTCELVQLAHNYDLKYLLDGPDYGYRTGINKTMLNHGAKYYYKSIEKNKFKKNDLVLDIVSNDGSV